MKYPTTMNVDNCTIDFEYLGSAGATIVPAVNEQFVRWREAFKIFLMDNIVYWRQGIRVNS